MGEERMTIGEFALATGLTPKAPRRRARPGATCRGRSRDGLPELHEAMLARALGRGDTAEGAVDGLLTAVRDAGAPDNAACVVLDLI